jgi:hypothetical protein
MKFYWSVLTIDGIRVLFDVKPPDEQLDVQIIYTRGFEWKVNKWPLITF